MDKVSTVIVAELDDDLHCLRRCDVNSVFPAPVVPAWCLTITRQDLEVVEMHVDWMSNVVDEPPDFDVAEARCRYGISWLVRLVVDRSDASAALPEKKRAGGDGATALQADNACTELLWNRRIV